MRYRRRFRRFRGVRRGYARSRRRGFRSYRRRGTGRRRRMARRRMPIGFRM